jgi:UDP-2,3-diacylglucosamine hydrolase
MADAPRAQWSDNATVLFIADLHLDPSRPRMIEAFRAFCEGPARAARALYILGDLFEVWIGDDDDDPVWDGVVEAIGALAMHGVAVHFMPGNRDFLVGDRLLARTGMQRLDDIEIITLGARRVLLCHGDTLCTDDTAYQAFRRQVRSAGWQRDFLAKPLDERRRIAAGLRDDSGDAMSGKSAGEMDVNPEAVRALCRAHAVEYLIHGHTNRPTVDHWTVDGTTVERRVLADWFVTGSMLRAHGGRVEAVDLDA